MDQRGRVWLWSRGEGMARPQVGTAGPPSIGTLGLSCWKLPGKPPRLQPGFWQTSKGKSVAVFPRAPIRSDVPDPRDRDSEADMWCTLQVDTKSPQVRAAESDAGVLCVCVCVCVWECVHECVRVLT